MTLHDKLDNFASFERLTEEITSFSSPGIRPGLRRVSRLLHLLGSPERRMRTIHVLGTNGKGSTAATIEAILIAGGLKTALYTSPHLISLQERLRVNGRLVALDDWKNSWERVVRAVDGDEELSSDRPSFFENFTAVCVLMMAEAEIDTAVIEAGMGGRYDATSVCNPIATLINPIGMDHTQYLGPTLADIASEKFAAVKSGVDAFYSGDDVSLKPVFLEMCAAAGAIPRILDEMALPYNIECTTDGTSFSYETMKADARNMSSPLNIGRLVTPLLGTHQAYNAARVVTLLLSLRDKFSDFAFIGPEVIKLGLSRVNWPCRMELARVSRSGRIVILDGAHNDHAMRALVASLDSMTNGGDKIKIGAVVFAVMGDKDISPILETMRPLDAPMYCTELPMERSEKSRDLAKLAQMSDIRVAGVFPAPADALREALSSTDPTEFVLCCGSLFLAGYIRKLLKYDGIL
ncbi:MAG: bifunctional folylpolyglutamate synthase/dihydrofolate synthase [Synergistaceae bacterium]|jgi:dihydrofolate synthase/folylpolyglutamate synthase|nr:bifunctional folylpolyglutamate synthase/dihydrofolate synthase [Synergistaceae bacterium]